MFDKFCEICTVTGKEATIQMVKERNTRRKHWINRLRNKYRLVFMNDETLEERFTFRLSRLNVFIALGTMTIILIFLTSILIAFTPLREYIPGYTNIGITKRLYELQIKTDSIEKDLVKKEGRNKKRYGKAQRIGGQEVNALAHLSLGSGDDKDR